MITDTLLQSLIGEISNEDLPIDRRKKNQKEETREDVYVVDQY